MSLPPLKGPRLKVYWARQHVAKLEDELLQFSRQAELRQDLTGKRGGLNIWTWRLSQPVPAEIPLLVGDAVHNARSALDILMCDIARLREKPTRNVRFVISKSKEQFEQQIRNRKEVKRIGSDIVSILRDIHGNEDLRYKLRKMHELDVADKHAVVVPAICSIAGQLSGPGFTMEPWTPDFVPALISDGMQEFVRENDSMFPRPAPPLKGQMALRYAFEPLMRGFYTDHWRGHVLPALDDFATASDQVIELFAERLGLDEGKL